MHDGEARENTRRLYEELGIARFDHDHGHWSCRVSSRAAYRDPLADGYSLNLATANRVFIVEPQWNPTVERQAVGRALRLGQESSVQVIRYVVHQTVEQVCQQASV
jgi:hypothetical protein